MWLAQQAGRRIGRAHRVSLVKPQNRNGAGCTLEIPKVDVILIGLNMQVAGPTLKRKDLHSYRCIKLTEYGLQGLSEWPDVLFKASIDALFVGFESESLKGT